jgi:MFS family permease
MQMFMLFIPQAIIIVVGPVVSYRSDRHRGPWGRRIPYLLLSTPFAFLAMLGIGISPAIGQAIHAHWGNALGDLDRTTRFCFGFFWIIFAVATTAANAVFGGLINDVVPQQLIGRFFGLFRAVSLIAGIFVNYSLLGLTKSHCTAMFVGIALVYSLGFVLMCVTVKEGDYPPPAHNTLVEQTGLAGAMWLYLKQSFSRPYYIGIMMAMMFGALCFNPVNNFSKPFATVMHIDDDAYGKYIGVAYVLSLAAAYWIGSLADRFHPLRVGIVSALLYAVLSFAGTFVSADPHVLFTVPVRQGGLPVQWFAIALVIHTFLSGVYFTCTASLGQRLFPRETFAQYSAAAAIVNAVCTMIFAVVIGKYFDQHGPLYHQTYAMGCGLALATGLMLLVVHGYFMKLGGPKNYVAPE